MSEFNAPPDTIYVISEAYIKQFRMRVHFLRYTLYGPNDVFLIVCFCILTMLMCFCMYVNRAAFSHHRHTIGGAFGATFSISCNRLVKERHEFRLFFRMLLAACRQENLSTLLVNQRTKAGRSKAGRGEAQSTRFPSAGDAPSDGADAGRDKARSS